MLLVLTQNSSLQELRNLYSMSTHTRYPSEIHCKAKIESFLTLQRTEIVAQVTYHINHFYNMNVFSLHAGYVDGSATYSQVIAFVRREPTKIPMYKSITTSSNQTISLTGNHLVYARNGPTGRFTPM